MNCGRLRGKKFLLFRLVIEALDGAEHFQGIGIDKVRKAATDCGYSLVLLVFIDREILKTDAWHLVLVAGPFRFGLPVSLDKNKDGGGQYGNKKRHYYIFTQGLSLKAITIP
jgi:hypothetical protein